MTTERPLSSITIELELTRVPKDVLVPGIDGCHFCMFWATRYNGVTSHCVAPKREAKLCKPYNKTPIVWREILK